MNNYKTLKSNKQKLIYEPCHICQTHTLQRWTIVAKSLMPIEADYYIFLIYPHCVKIVHIGSFFWSVFSCIRTEYRNIRTRKNSVFGYFSRSPSISLDIRGISFPVFTFWKARHNYYKWVITGILHKKLGLTENF